MPHKEEYREFAPETYPPFPEGFPTVELETISLVKLLDGDATEKDRVFEECKGRGFFYLELGGCETGEAIVAGADEMAMAGEEIFKLPYDEKMRYQMSGKSLYGYKRAGATNADPKLGTKDTAEFFNVGKNDMIGPDEAMTRSWPRLVMDMKPQFADYVRAAHGTGLLVLRTVAEKLGVDPHEFVVRHRIEESSDDHVRITRGPPRETDDMPEIQTPSHTDFGTITILMNWLGGLQVYSQSSRRAYLHNGDPDVPGEWLWVKPRRGCAIVNLGDAAVKFTNGVLCSGRHRVVPAPGAQGRYPRYSIVYFVRPENATVMRQLRAPGIPDGPEDDEELTAREWITRQATNLGISFPTEKAGRGT